MAQRLAGKVALITGGASGIGRGTAELFVEEGARVVIADINDEKGEAVANGLGKSRCRYVRTNVAKETELRACIDATVSEFGRLDILFNNAGVSGPLRSLKELTVEEYREGMDVLLLSNFMGIKHAIPHMERQGGGSIINTSSIAGIRVLPHTVVYAVAKAAVLHLTRVAAVHHAGSNIRVNAVIPGGIVTPMFASTSGAHGEGRRRGARTDQRVFRAQPTIKTGWRAGRHRRGCALLRKRCIAFRHGSSVDHRRWSYARTGDERRHAERSASSATKLSA